VTALIHSAIATPGQFRIGFLANSAVSRSFRPSGQAGIAYAPRNSLTKTAIRFLLLFSHISCAILSISSPQEDHKSGVKNHE
jgi:hypothetical protein